MQLLLPVVERVKDEEHMVHLLPQVVGLVAQWPPGWSHLHSQQTLGAIPPKGIYT